MILPTPTESNSASAAKRGGPKTEEAKLRSRLNADHPGLSGDALRFAEDRPEEFERRLTSWRDAFIISNEHDEWAFRMMVAESMRREQCRAIAITITAELSRRADDSWESDARRAAIELAENLSRKPVLTCARLRSSKYGCELLAERWDGLIRVLEAEGDWDDAQKRLALDILGVDPRLRSGHRLFRLGFPDAGRELLSERLSFAAAEVAKLRDLSLVALVPKDAGEQDLARAGVFLDEPKTIAVLRRYEKDAARRQNQLFRQLRRAPRLKLDAEKTPRAPKPSAPKPIKPASMGLPVAALVDLPSPQSSTQTDTDRPTPEVTRARVATTPADRKALEAFVERAYDSLGAKPVVTRSKPAAFARR